MTSPTHPRVVAGLFGGPPHGGYGLGDSEAVIRRHAPKAVLERGFSMQADQERQTMDKVTGWLRDAQLVR